jgi:hypothetical protein
VDVTIDDLKVRQTPIVEQFRPFIIAMVAPDSEQWDPVIYLGILPEPPTRLAAAPRLEPPQERHFAARGIAKRSRKRNAKSHSCSDHRKIGGGLCHNWINTLIYFIYFR